MDATDLSGKMVPLQLKEKAMLYNCHMSFLGHGGLFVLTDDVLSLGDEVLLAVEVIDRPKKFLRAQVAWINPIRTSVYRPKGAGLVFGMDEICIQAKQLIEAELGNVLHSDRVAFTL